MAMNEQIHGFAGEQSKIKEEMDHHGRTFHRRVKNRATGAYLSKV
tara:strand:+ start:13894 stop:14028 length:135 start_codon:yes stop_codon:yes gene_type:complete